MIDAGTRSGAHALERLKDERIAWLTTVTPEGQPQTLPIWFIWEDGTILFYGKKVAVRNGNLRQNPRVAFHLSDDGVGGDIVEIEGEAVLDPSALPSNHHAAYLAKYGELLAGYGWTPEYFAAEYPHRYRIRPTAARYH
jgi:PPOX class probable F420-dependent enzyme